MQKTKTGVCEKKAHPPKGGTTRPPRPRYQCSGRQLGRGVERAAKKRLTYPTAGLLCTTRPNITLKSGEGGLPARDCSMSLFFADTGLNIYIGVEFRWQFWPRFAGERVRFRSEGSVSAAWSRPSSRGTDCGSQPALDLHVGRTWLEDIPPTHAHRIVMAEPVGGQGRSHPSACAAGERLHE